MAGFRSVAQLAAGSERSVYDDDRGRRKQPYRRPSRKLAVVRRQRTGEAPIVAAEPRRQQVRQDYIDLHGIGPARKLDNAAVRLSLIDEYPTRRDLRKAFGVGVAVHQMKLDRIPLASVDRVFRRRVEVDVKQVEALRADRDVIAPAVADHELVVVIENREGPDVVVERQLGQRGADLSAGVYVERRLCAADATDNWESVGAATTIAPNIRSASRFLDLLRLLLRRP